MKKAILFCLFLLIAQVVQAEDFKGKFMLSFKTGDFGSFEDRITKTTFLGSQVDYFIGNRTLVGFNLNYMEYIYLSHSGIFPAYYGAPTGLQPKWRWYSIGLSGKLLFDKTRFSPFFKIGFGLYIPQVTSPREGNPDIATPFTLEKTYGKTCLGYNFGIGIQYRFWSRFGLLLEGAIEQIDNKNKYLSSNSFFTFGSLQAGISLIF